MKRKILTIGLIGILLSGIVILGKILNKTIKENNRLKANTSILIEQSGQAGEEMKALVMNVDELKQVIKADSLLQAQLKDSLQIKEKHIESLTTLVISMEGQFKTELRDTTIYVIGENTVWETIYLPEPIQAKAFSWNNNYLFMDGIVYSDSVDISYKHSDRGAVVIHKKKYKKYFWQRWFEKSTLVGSVITEDPNNTILIDNVIISK